MLEVEHQVFLERNPVMKDALCFQKEIHSIFLEVDWIYSYNSQLIFKKFRSAVTDNFNLISVPFHYSKKKL